MTRSSSTDTLGWQLSQPKVSVFNNIWIGLNDQLSFSSKLQFVALTENQLNYKDINIQQFIAQV